MKTHHLSAKLDEPFAFSQNWISSRSTTVIEIVSDEGTVGYGESYGPPEAICPTIDRLLKPVILKADPCDVEVLWEKMYNTLRDSGQKGIAVASISGIDIALWDLIGKELNKPIHKLIGGSFRDKVMAYATGLYQKRKDDPVKDLVDEAATYVQQGFKAMKMKIGFGPDRDLKNVKAVREAIGSNVLLMVDANHAYDARTAIRLGRNIEKYDIYWFEEPVPPEDVEGYAEVKSKIGIPISGGECEFTRFGFRNLITQRVLDIAQPDTCAAGGITECKKIASMANSCGIHFIPHVWGGPIAIAASLHLIASLPDYPPSLNPISAMLEFDRTPNPIREELARQPFSQIDGYVQVPKGAGLGITIDEEALRRYCVTCARS